MSTKEMNTQEKEVPIEVLRTEQAVKSPLILSMLVFPPTPLLGNQAVRHNNLFSAHTRTAVDEGSRGVAVNSVHGSCFCSAGKQSASVTSIHDYLASVIVKSP